MTNEIQTSFLGTKYRPPTRLELLSVRERPDTRLSLDADTCSLTELLAVIVGGREQLEQAERLIAKFGTIRQLNQAHPNEIMQVTGAHTALRIKAALALGRRLLQPEEERPAVHSPSDAAQILMPILVHRDQEYMVVMVLDTRNRVIATHEAYHGSLNSASVRVGELFKPAIEQNGAAIIVAHCHPSGDPAPSPEDVAITRSIVQAGKLLDINCLDHMIIGNGGRWVSLKEKGLGFS
jgi:DNA repair protein RadC